jgi:hypothetical protein
MTATLTLATSPARFLARCPKAEFPERGKPPVVCDETFTDRRAYVEHMTKAHRCKYPPTTKIDPRPDLPTRRRDWTPGPLDPGQRVTYSVHAEWRTGVVWSKGPVPSSLWVLPDDAPADAVAVKVWRSRSGGGVSLDLLPEHSDWRHTVRQFETLRAAGVVFAVRETGRWTLRRERDDETGEQRTVYAREWDPRERWHADPQCPDAVPYGRALDDEGREKSRRAEPSAWRFLGEFGRARWGFGSAEGPDWPRWCRRCVMLDDCPEIPA